jgi:hypothetical protein
MRAKRGCLATLPAALLLAAALAPPATGAAKKEAPAPPGEFAPDAAAAGVPRIEGSTWILEADLFTARLAMLPDAARLAFIEQRAGSRVDPFGARDAGFLTFLLEVESKAGGSLVLQPQRCRLITNLKEFGHPLDMPTLEASYALLDTELPPAYAVVRPALLDGEVVLPPGGQASGLLVYRGVKSKTRSFVVEILVTTPAGELAEFKVPYRRVKPGK